MGAENFTNHAASSDYLPIVDPPSNADAGARAVGHAPPPAFKLTREQVADPCTPIPNP